jgi:CDP-glucose 4,6-dehydratase
MERLKGHNILVTGGTGFVGSHLCEALVGLGARVIVPYRSVDPSSYFSVKNLEKRVVMAQGDVTDRRRMVDIVTKYEIEDIFHLAAQPIVQTAYNNPIETITTNVLGAAHVLDAAWNSGTVKRIVMTSSDKAYGKSDKPYREDDPLRGDHPYEASKSAADMITQSYIRTYGAPVATVRFGNIYGPGDLNASRIIPGIMHTVVNGGQLVLRSDGTFVRDYVYVGDVVSAYIYLLEHFDTTKGETYNIASRISLSVVDLIKQSEKILGVPIRYVIKNTQVNEIPYQHLDWSKIAKVGWSPKFTLEMGLLETFGWYKKHAT